MHQKYQTPYGIFIAMMTSSNGNMFCITGPLCGEFTGDRWIPSTKASDAVLVLSLIYAWTNGWVNNRNAGDLRRHHAHYDITVIWRIWWQNRLVRLSQQLYNIIVYETLMKNIHHNNTHIFSGWGWWYCVYIIFYYLPAAKKLSFWSICLFLCIMYSEILASL